MTPEKNTKSVTHEAVNMPVSVERIEEKFNNQVNM